MTQPLPRVIQANPGQPASVRVGRITSVNPFVLNVQGAEFNSDAVGVLAGQLEDVAHEPVPGGGPLVGDVVDPGPSLDGEAAW